MIALLGLVPFVVIVFGGFIYLELGMFLWQGSHYFRDMRRRLAAALVCSRCAREVLVPGAKFCGKCGGKLRRAA